MRVRNFPQDIFRNKLDSALVALKDPRVDTASHFILRAAYCRTEDLRRWFLQQECILFRHRLSSASNIDSNVLTDLLLSSNSSGPSEYQKVSEEEKQSLRAELVAAGSTNGYVVSLSEFRDRTYYKIPFTQALDLISSRQVYVKRGYAYVPTKKLVSTIAARFRAQVSGSLTRASSAFHDALAGDEHRIGPLLKNMNQCYTGKDFTSTAKAVGGLSPQTVDELSERSMPLCMKQLQSGLRQDHKLKHWGRMQYGLFLKGAGLSMEDSLLFFQTQFAKIMSTEQFQKQYSYNIRHMYGKEGKRVSYTPYNCTRIIMGNPPQAGDHHGCPYRHYDDAHLSALLSKLHISSNDVDSILHLKHSKNYNLACVKHFEVTHPGATSGAVKGLQLDGVGNHPNAWFQASSSYYELKNGTSPKDVKMKASRNSSPSATVHSFGSPNEVKSSGGVNQVTPVGHPEQVASM